MSQSVDDERKEIAVEYRLERSKRIRRQFDDVVRLWLEGLTVTETARRLVMKKDRVYFLRRVLELTRVGRQRTKWRPGHLYGLKVPGIEDSHEG